VAYFAGRNACNMIFRSCWIRIQHHWIQILIPTGFRKCCQEWWDKSPTGQITKAGGTNAVIQLKYALRWPNIPRWRSLFVDPVRLATQLPMFLLNPLFQRNNHLTWATTKYRDDPLELVIHFWPCPACNDASDGNTSTWCEVCDVIFTGLTLWHWVLLHTCGY